MLELRSHLGKIAVVTGSSRGIGKAIAFAGKDFFESLFVTVHPDKKEKARDALTGIYRFLHLGPHEQANQQNSIGEPVINRQDACFALILAQAAFGYMTSGN